MADLDCSVPKQTYLGIKKEAPGSVPGTIGSEYILLRLLSDSKEFKVHHLKRVRMILCRDALPNLCSVFIYA